MKKVYRCKTPQGEWGVGSEGAYWIYLITVFTMLEVDANGTYRYGSKCIQVLEKHKVKNGVLGGLWTT